MLEIPDYLPDPLRPSCSREPFPSRGTDLRSDPCHRSKPEQGSNPRRLCPSFQVSFPRRGLSSSYWKVQDWSGLQRPAQGHQQLPRLGGKDGEIVISWKNKTFWNVMLLLLRGVSFGLFSVRMSSGFAKCLSRGLFLNPGSSRAYRRLHQTRPNRASCFVI